MNLTVGSQFLKQKSGPDRTLKKTAGVEPCRANNGLLLRHTKNYYSIKKAA